MRKIILVIAMALIVSAANSQQHQDPQAVIDSLIRQQQRQDATRQHNEASRLELEQLELEKQLRYRRLSDGQIMGELGRYCPRGSASCTQRPPDVLLKEAVSRGLIQFQSAPRAPQGNDCASIRIDDDMAITDCQ